MKELQLTVVTPDGKHGPIRCDSVHLTISDDLSGKGGGSCGIRPGHVAALMSVDCGPITAMLKGEVVFSADGGSGFASVDGDSVTIVTDKFSRK